MKKGLLLMNYLICCGFLLAQNTGDTIRVKSFTYDNPSRDLVASFPDDPNLTFEKVLLKYSMRCKDGLVSTVSSPNLGCGQWDFSNNTYLVDSSKVSIQPNFIPSHFITNFDGDEFRFSETPVYDYERSSELVVTDVSGDFQNTTTIGNENISLNRALATNNVAGRSFYLYTAEELEAAGATPGNIEGIELDISSNASQAGFLRINMKHTTKEVLDGEIDMDGFQQVYYNNTNFDASGLNPFVFSSPFVWDGVSNLLLEFTFTNAVSSELASTVLRGESTDVPMGMTSTSEQEFELANRTYIECLDYKGIGGNQNRTIEAWVRADVTNAIVDIMAWGIGSTTQKYTFLMTSGKLRLEVSGSGTVGTTRIDDGEWHHVSAVLNGNNVANVRFYIDGRLDPNSVVGNTAINTATETNVRVSRGINNRFFTGGVDDVRIWDTALDVETINKWKSLKINETHPNYSNLQLNFEFDGTGDDIQDSSPHGRNARVIGTEIRSSQSNGASLFKDFVLENQRPKVNFLQGNDGQITTEEITIDRPLGKQPPHFVATRTIEHTNPNLAFDDNILISPAVQYWTLDTKIYDADTGAIIEENNAAQDGVINVVDLEYDRRFPFYNELVSFVTPYGIGLDLGDNGISWYIDVTDYLPILKGDKRLQMTLGGQNQEEMDLEFFFIVGTPPRDVIQFDQIWQGTNQIGIASITQLAEDAKFAPKDVNLSADASTFKLKSSITGHGVHGEFGQNGGIVSHRISTPEGFLFDWNITQECSLNPIFPQGGTWVHDRQGWCPGEQTLITENDLTSVVEPGGIINIDYSTSAPAVPTGDYRYHVAHQIVGYGDPNFQVDASVIEISAPNNSAEYRRVGEICANPMITIRNTGATELTSLVINYWINDSQNPQSFEWEGSLDFMEAETVTIPAPRDLWFDLLDENNRFHVLIDSPNGQADQYEYNNTMSSNFDFPDVLPANITVEFRTNNSPQENSYELIDAAGNVIGSNPLASSNTFISDDYELIDDCYTLIVKDTGGDGLEWFANPAQGVGIARIKNEAGSILRTFEPDFGGGFEFRFTTDFVVSVQDLEFIRSIEVFPNPASDIVTIEANDMNDTNVFLTDVLGRNVSASIMSKTDNSISFNVQFLNSGVYFIVLKKDDVRTTRKLIIE